MSDTAAPDAPATSTPPSVRRWPRIAVTVVFVVHGLLFASWTAHIPDVKAHLALTDGTLGFALLVLLGAIAFASMLCEGAALAGFASLGIGLASIVPAVFSAAGHITGKTPPQHHGRPASAGSTR